MIEWTTECAAQAQHVWLPFVILASINALSSGLEWIALKTKTTRDDELLARIRPNLRMAQKVLDFLIAKRSK